MKIGFIGMGNMAKAMIGGLLKKGIFSAEEIIGSAKTEGTIQAAAKKYGIRTTMDNRMVSREADFIILAIKPIFFDEVMEEIKGEITPEKVVISIAAGKSIASMENVFGGDKQIVRCMPNTPALVMEGCTGICLNSRVSKDNEAQVLKILSSFGMAQIVPERLMDVVVGISGSSPAYVFIFMEAMADEAVAAGMPRKQAYEFAAQAVMGSAKLMMETGKHPGELKDMVCSPGGTTIAAVKVMEEKGFRGVVMDAMEACIEKSKNL